MVDEIEHCLDTSISVRVRWSWFERYVLYRPNPTPRQQDSARLIELCLREVSDSLGRESKQLAWMVHRQMDSYQKRERFLLDNEADWLVKMSATFIDSSRNTPSNTRFVSRGKTVAIQADFANGQDDSLLMKKWEHKKKKTPPPPPPPPRCFTGKALTQRK